MTFAPSCRFPSNISFLHPRPFVLKQRPTNSSFQVLVMDGNQLRQLRGASFGSSNLRFLTDLSLTNCRLSTLSDQTFSDLTRLVTINLSNNNLTSLSATVNRFQRFLSDIFHPCNISDVQLVRPPGGANPEREPAELSGSLFLPRPQLPHQDRPLPQRDCSHQPQGLPQPGTLGQDTRPSRQPPGHSSRSTASTSLQSSGEEILSSSYTPKLHNLENQNSKDPFIELT